ncbi:hypothetical protein CLOP_g7788 [Closterium sp. NIES-67]|nr:hypothetical protein CLOP_g7788 [Closterium sp. NIES-67]
MASGNSRLTASLRVACAALLRTLKPSAVSAAPLSVLPDRRFFGSSAAHSAANTAAPPAAAATAGAGDSRHFSSAVGGASGSGPDGATCQLEVWSWGRGDSGQLGHWEENPEWAPRRIESLSLEISALAAAGVAAAGSDAAAAGGAALGVAAKAGGGSAGEALTGLAATGQARTVASRSADLSRLKEELRAGVSCGISHSLLWLGGRLWVWGRGDGGRLGLGNELSLYFPTLNPDFSGAVVRSAAAGGLHSLAVSEAGELFTWGYGGFGALGHGEFTRRDVPCHVAPSDWLEEGVEIKSAAAGASHTLALTTAGGVYAWGRDEGEGRLGCPHIVEALGEEGCVPRPIPIDFPASQGLPRGGLSLVSCGGFFSAAVDCDGSVWTWGGNHNGELGRAASGLHPGRVKTITSPITHAAAGGFHTLAVDDEGCVWSWGRGGSGQLGQHSLLTQPMPRVVPGLAGVKIARVAAGSAWSAAVSEKGQLFVWGKNSDGQLGLGAGQPKIIDEPCELSLPSLPLLSHEQGLLSANNGVKRMVLDVSTGTSHGVCICLCVPS